MTLTLPIHLDPTSAPDKTLHVTASGLPVRIYSINGDGGLSEQDMRALANDMCRMANRRDEV
jgi:hypothetical protein